LSARPVSNGGLYTASDGYSHVATDSNSRIASDGNSLAPKSDTCSPDSDTHKTPPTGISGMVKYTGTKLGSILVFVSTKSGSAPMGEDAVKSFMYVSGGELLWSLPAGSDYYVGALLQGSGASGIDYPFVSCGPIEVKSTVLVKIQIVLTDAEIGGKPRDCRMKSP
jgi:hypothetical protein